MGKRKTINRHFERVEDLVVPKAKIMTQSMCSLGFITTAVKTLSLIIFYYCFSISLTFYNQRFIHTFRFPLSITMVHLVTKFLMAIIVRTCLRCKSGEKRIVLSWKDYITRISPPGIASSLDIGLSNWSFEYITISLYTMTKSTVIIFILGFSILLRLEKARCSLVFVILFIASGLFMFTFQSTQFHLIGFLMVFGASFLSGLRWTLSQLILQKTEIGLNNPIDMMYHIQPWMILALLPLSAMFEGLHLSTTVYGFAFHEYKNLALHIGVVMIGAGLAFMLELSEFLLVMKTSGLTLSVSGIFKELCTLYLATKINDDKMTFLNGLGLVICLCGIALHVILKAVASNKSGSSQHADDAVELLLQNGEAVISEDEEDEVDIFNMKRDR